MESFKVGDVECWWDENAKHYEIGTSAGFIEKLADAPDERWMATFPGFPLVGYGETPRAAFDALAERLRKERDRIEEVIGKAP